jgi:hypothetical protein
MCFVAQLFVLIFILIFETSSDCEESNVYHLKKSILFIRGSCTGPVGRVARMCLCTCFVK